MMRLKRGVLLLVVLSMLVSVVYAQGIIQDADRLNYWDSETHIVSLSNTGSEATSFNFTIPTGWTWISGSNCFNTTNTVSCSIAAAGSGFYTLTSPGSADDEYDLTTISPITNNSYPINDVMFIRIQDHEIFHTLVEYGRGRGNYFFDSGYDGKAGSGHTGAGCNYVPNGTLFELNFLHKVLNVKHYFGNLSAHAYNASFSCIYPNSSIVRQHLITATVSNSTGVYVSYLIPKIEGSWERMGYLGMDFQSDEQYVGENLDINCTNMTYYFPNAGGHFVVDEDSFSLEVRDRYPFIASATSTSTIGNGTQEVLITYNITNTELYTVDNVIIEIQAPEYATFIGTRGELWGTALDQYRIEKAELQPGESEIITLVARFDTTNAPDISSINLTSGIKLKFTTCWELNAYNPTEYKQDIFGIGTTPVDMGVPSTIIDLRERLVTILNITEIINTTITEINDTTNNIQTIVTIINTTTQETNIIVTTINTTANTILNETTIILSNTEIILNDTSYIYDLLNCNGSIDSPICDKISVINSSISQRWKRTIDLNNTANNLNITVFENINTSGVNITVDIDLTNITNSLYEVKGLINCTVNYTENSACGRLERIENLTAIINDSTQTILNTTTYFNTSVFGNLTFQDIIDALDNVTIDTSDVLRELQEAREFDEELVFLVTDSFGLQEQSRADFLKGDVVSSADKLVSSNQRLLDVMDKVILERDTLVAQDETSTPIKGAWIWIALLALFIIIIFYLFGKVPDNKPGGTR